MAVYYINRNAQPSGEHEVHTSECTFLPSPENRILLGAFYSCQNAIIEARKYYPNVDGCFYCCLPCHKK